MKTRRALLRAAQALQFADDEHNPFVRYTSAPRRARGWLRLSEQFLMDLEEDTSYVPNFAVCPRHTAPLAAFAMLDRYARLATPKIKKSVTTRMRTASRAPWLSFRKRVPAVPSGVVRFYERFLNPDAKTLLWLESPKADTAVRQVFAMLWKQQNLFFRMIVATVRDEKVRLGSSVTLPSDDAQFRKLWTMFWMRTHHATDFIVISWLTGMHPDTVSDVWHLLLPSVALNASLYGFAVSDVVRGHIAPDEFYAQPGMTREIAGVFDNSNETYHFKDAEDQRDAFSKNKGPGITWVVMTNLFGLFVMSCAYYARGTDDTVAQSAGMLLLYAVQSTFCADRGYGSMWKWPDTWRRRLRMLTPAFKNGAQFCRRLVEESAILARARMIVEHCNAAMKNFNRLLGHLHHKTLPYFNDLLRITSYLNVVRRAEKAPGNHLAPDDADLNADPGWCNDAKAELLLQHGEAALEREIVVRWVRVYRAAVAAGAVSMSDLSKADRNARWLAISRATDSERGVKPPPPPPTSLLECRERLICTIEEADEQRACQQRTDWWFLIRSCYNFFLLVTGSSGHKMTGDGGTMRRNQIEPCTANAAPNAPAVVLGRVAEPHSDRILRTHDQSPFRGKLDRRPNGVHRLPCTELPANGNPPRSVFAVSMDGDYVTAAAATMNATHVPALTPLGQETKVATKVHWRLRKKIRLYGVDPTTNRSGVPKQYYTQIQQAMYCGGRLSVEGDANSDAYPRPFHIYVEMTPINVAGGTPLPRKLRLLAAEPYHMLANEFLVECDIACWWKQMRGEVISVTFCVRLELILWDPVFYMHEHGLMLAFTRRSMELKWLSISEHAAYEVVMSSSTRARARRTRTRPRRSVLGQVRSTVRT